MDWITLTEAMGNDPVNWKATMTKIWNQDGNQVETQVTQVSRYQRPITCAAGKIRITTYNPLLASTEGPFQYAYSNCTRTGEGSTDLEILWEHEEAAEVDNPAAWEAETIYTMEEVSAKTLMEQGEVTWEEYEDKTPDLLSTHCGEEDTLEGNDFVLKADRAHKHSIVWKIILCWA